MIQVGIIGGAGYTAGELIRLLIHHPQVTIDFVYSTSNAGNPVYKIHQDLNGETDLIFTNTLNANVDVLFLCLGHGNSKSFLSENKFASHTKIIDLSNDFRLTKDAIFEGKEFIYGLPELNLEAIKKAQYIANPGCFATAIQLALLPLAAAKKLTEDVHINAVTGATGAGTSLSETTHFAWRDNNFSYYKPFTHQHLGEINQTLQQLQNGYSNEVIFMPFRGNFSRGIFASIYTPFEGTIEDAKNIYKTYYKDAVFTTVSDSEIHMKQAVNTNKCLVHLHKHGNKLLISSVIDNLTKGASGQAIHNMNLMFGWPENEGLKLKANYF
jgi:N-acetyl-gamma-glutamyl-phosphate reductase